MRVFGIEESEEVCANCEHFQQYYTKREEGRWERLIRVNAGHCVHPRIKHRNPGDTCKNFTPRS